MLEKYEGWIIKCDKCGRYMNNDEDLRLVSDINTIQEECDIEEWIIIDDKHYCNECK